MEHTFYVQALGLTAAAKFPCFTDDSISGYPALLHDLENLLSPFFVGPEDEFIAIAKLCMQAQQRRPEDESRDLTYYATGEDRLKTRARELFRAGRYDEVVQIESQVRFPDLLTESERKIFELA